MRVASLFSGMGGFDCAAEAEGLSVVFQCETDPHCLRVLAHHWSGVKRMGDVRSVRRTDIPPADVVCGGFPCQDLSVAGKRAGLAGARSGLWWEFARILGEVLPRWVVIENVPGLFSSAGGRDFAVIVSGLVQLGYGVAWRVLDSQFDRVAQRRRRVFIVGCLGDPCLAAQVLFEPESSDWDSAPGRSERADIADTITRSFAKHHGASAGKDSQPRNHVLALDGHMGTAGLDDNAAQAGHLLADTLQGHHQRNSPDGDNLLVASTLRSRQSTPGVSGPGRGGEDDENLVVYQCHGSNVGPMGTLRRGNGDVQSGVPFVAHALSSEGADASEDGTGRGTPLAVAGFKRGQGTKARSDGWRENQSPTLTSTDSGTQQPPGMQVGMAVRRLTPTEYLRLQAFPDDWLDLDPPLSDAAKYRMAGNGVTVNVVRWIFRRIRQVGI